MRSTWPNVLHMSKMIQIRNVPDDLHRELKVRATREGATLSDYLLAELREIAGRPTLSQWLEEAAQLAPTQVTTKQIVAAVRDGRRQR